MSSSSGTADMKDRRTWSLLPTSDISNVCLTVGSSDTYPIGGVGSFVPENMGPLEEGPGACLEWRAGCDKREGGGSGGRNGRMLRRDPAVTSDLRQRDFRLWEVRLRVMKGPKGRRMDP